MTVAEVRAAVAEMTAESSGLLSLVLNCRDSRELSRVENLSELNLSMIDELADVLPADVVDTWRSQEEDIIEAVARRRVEIGANE